MAGLLAGVPREVAAVTVNRFCGSSMQAIHNAAGAIALGAGEAFVCAGVESMTRVPMLVFNFVPNPELYERCPGAYLSMGETAENLASRDGIDRSAQERFAIDPDSLAMTERALEVVPAGFRALDQVPMGA